MPLQTTVIGAWPKPDYLVLPDWFKSKLPTTGEINQASYDPRERAKVLQDVDKDKMEKMVQRARDEVIEKQVALGLDVITDGEIERENYIFHCARNFQGINMEFISTKTIRDGACMIKVPTITSKIELLNDNGTCWMEWEKSQHSLNNTLKTTQSLISNDENYMLRLKYTIPGPMTIVDMLSDSFYGESNQRGLIQDLISCLNKEILALAKHGCRIIQIDEPVLMRKPEEAINYGIDDIVACFKGIPSNVTTIVHLCCGYPSYLDHEGYKKADKQLYVKLASLLDKTGIHQFSIEDAEACNDLGQLLPKFKQSKVILGTIKVARSAIESVEEIEARVKDALQYIDGERLILAPDCGLGFLSEEIVKEKIRNMVKVAKSSN